RYSLSLHDALPILRALVDALRGLAIEDPPQVAVAEAAVAAPGRVHLVHRRDRARALAHPRTRHDLPAGPVALAQHEVADARHVARREVRVVGQVLRSRGVAAEAWPRAVDVRHAARAGERLVERVEDALAGELREDGAQRVEVPVVVEVVLAGRLRPAGRRAGHVVAAVGRGVVDAGACGE